MELSASKKKYLYVLKTIMNITPFNNNTHYSFKGYDVTFLKGFYMQGLNKPSERRIFYEMSKIAKENNLDLFVNQNNKGIKNFYPKK